MKAFSNLKHNQAEFFLQSQLVTNFSLDKLVIYRCDFNIEYYHQELFNLLKIKFPFSLTRSVTKRQAEYLAGRYVANLALCDLGTDKVDIEIGENRSPVWPKGIVAAITHTNKVAMCAASNADNYCCLGIDLENFLSLDTVRQIKDVVLHKNEEALLRANELEFKQAVTLAFSAKESLFKALYPRVGYYFDFEAAKITYLSLSEKQFELTLRKDLTAELLAGTQFMGHFVLDSQSVTTLIAKES